MSFTVIDQYNSFVENNFIKSNRSQLDVLKKNDTIWNNNKKTNLFSKSNKKNGVYLVSLTKKNGTRKLNFLKSRTIISTSTSAQNVKIQKKTVQ